MNPSALETILAKGGITVLHGEALKRRSSEWIEAIVAGTIQNPAGLLTKTRADIEEVVAQDRIFVAFHEATGAFVGSAVMWELLGDWSELGTIYVVPAWRFAVTGLPVTQYLHLLAVATFEDAGRFVIETSTVPAVVHGARTRHGMETPSFRDLPDDVHTATCCCPIDKTGTTDNVASCRRMDNPCVLMAGPRTAEYIRQFRRP